MPLTHFDLKNAKPAGKPYKISDGGGLHAAVMPSGSILWRFKYRFHGIERLLSIGPYPIVSLADARAKRDEAKRLLLSGCDPATQKRLDRLAAETAAKTTFRVLAEEYIANLEANGASPATLAKTRWLLLDLASPLAARPVAQVTPAELLDLLKRIERSGRRETARRLRGVIGAVFRLAVTTLRAESDPTWALKGALLRPKVKPRAAITDEKRLGGLMNAIHDYDGWPTIAAALKFTALTFARPGEVRGARRSEFNADKSVWRIPPERTKMRRAHEVPLSQQASAVLEEVWPLSDFGELVFPSIRSNRRPLSENAMNSALRRMGYGKDEMTAHGFRAAASTILNERGFNRDVIEAALGHQDENEIRRAYNRAAYWPERVNLMQEWADLLDGFARSRH
jgi:integrase